MSVTSILDNMISVTDLNRGGASKTLSRVGNNHPVIVLDGNRPSAVIITPDDYFDKIFRQHKENTCGWK